MRKSTRRRSSLFWWVVVGPLVVLGAITAEAFPYMAITEPSGSKVLVVEGWMDPEALQEAAELVRDSSYAQVYTTGTVREFAYYLSSQEGISVELHDPVEGSLNVTVSGNTGAGFLLIAGADTLLDQAVTPRPENYRTRLAVPTDHIRVVAWALPMAPDAPELYVSGLTTNGSNINLYQRRSWFTFPDAMAKPAWPTYAQSARSALIRSGIAPELITAVPAYGKPRSRSWGNAHAFGIKLRGEGITAFDVATVGVHARRSRNLFQAAAGPSVRVGVIALTDPHCTKANWWKSYRGWYTMLKEVVGAPEAQAVELTR